MQAKCRISKKKDESNEPLRLKQYKQRAKVMHWYGLYTYINSPRKPLMVNTANELRPGIRPGVHWHIDTQSRRGKVVR